MSGETIFTTLRLARSLSASQGRALRATQLAAQQQLRAHLDASTAPAELAAHQRRTDKQFFAAFDAALDWPTVGPAWFAEDEQMAETLAGELLMLEESGFAVPAFAILPNHVHAVVHRPAANRLSLPKALELLHRRTAQQCRRFVRPRLPPEADFWATGSYDYLVQDAEELGRLVRYVRNNSRQAGLPPRFQQWPYVPDAG